MTIRKEYPIPVPVPYAIYAESGEVVANVAVHVRMKNYRWWNIRLVVGLAIMRLGIWITGMGYEFEGVEGDEE